MMKEQGAPPRSGRAYYIASLISIIYFAAAKTSEMLAMAILAARRHYRRDQRIAPPDALDGL